ncbi:CLUMA_CG000620, isoform A [Clunio marinus]|uniref:CLUMA_CG000620, isoform A n=1 Tax=Clunio marinus TaxID=568069 RepID=A0A1J1HFJ4_9DIPT|nr:CLUMA_CG000620, isoform A [Clunio marinus]
MFHQQKKSNLLKEKRKRDEMLQLFDHLKVKVNEVALCIQSFPLTSFKAIYHSHDPEHLQLVLNVKPAFGLFFYAQQFSYIAVAFVV